jgi:hypothetical protein
MTFLNVDNEAIAQPGKLRQPFESYASSLAQLPDLLTQLCQIQSAGLGSVCFGRHPIGPY